MDTKFMNPKNSKKLDTYRLFLNVTKKNKLKKKQ